MKPVVAVIAALVAAAAGPVVQAAEWRLAPFIGTSLVNESNPGFASQSANAQQAVVADLSLQLARQTETTMAIFNSSVTRRQYSEDRSLDRSDLRADLSLQHAATERFSWSASAAAMRDTTLTSELGTSGATRVGDRHESLSAQLQPEWLLSERLSAALQLQLQRDYYPSADSDLTDYRYHSAGLISTWRRSPQDSIGIVVRAGRTQIALQPDDNLDASASIQYTRSIDERWRFSLVAGPAWARGFRSTQRGENISFDLSRAAQYGAVSLSLARGIAPTGRGYLTRRDSLSLQLRRDLGAQLSGSLGARYLRSRNVVGPLNFTFDDVRYRRLEAGISWSFSPQWSTELRGGYSDQRQSAGGTRASGADVGLSIRWSGKNHVS